MSNSSSIVKKRSWSDSLPFVDSNKRRAFTQQENYRKKKLFQQEEGLFAAVSSNSSVADEAEDDRFILGSLQEGSPSYLRGRLEGEYNEEEEELNRSLKEEIRKLSPKKNPSFDVNALARSVAASQMYNARYKIANDLVLGPEGASDMTIGEFSKNSNAILSRNNVQSKRHRFV